MASQITACQRRKQFITLLKGASLYWLFLLLCSLRNDAGASGSFLPSFFRDFSLLFWLCTGDLSLLSARGREGFGLGTGAAMALSLLMEGGTLRMNYPSPTKASATTTKPERAAAQSHFPSRLSTARLRESH